MKNKPIRIKRAANLKGDDGHKVFSVRLADELVNKLDDIAAKTNLTRNKLVNIFLEYGVNNWELEE